MRSHQVRIGAGACDRGGDGSVKHVHVIHASAAQQQNVEDAVRQWKFKPYANQGHPVEVETAWSSISNQQACEAGGAKTECRCRCKVEGCRWQRGRPP